MSFACMAVPKMIQYFCTYMHLFGDIAVSVLQHRGGFYCCIAPRPETQGI